MSTLRLPDFIIIGAMKSGTSSLYQWLAEQPEISLPEIKEPHFFSRDEVWARGIEWYSSLFCDTPGQLVGEASTSYTRPENCEDAATRLRVTVPDARLIYVVRHPIERVRSQYRHALWRGAERRSLLEALADPANPYVRRSLYFRCLDPYLRAFPREQICVVRLEDLVSEEAPGWAAVLRHIGIPWRPVPRSAHNVSSEKRHFSRMMRWIWTSPLRSRIAQVPRPIRRFVGPLLLHEGPRYQARLEGSKVPIPTELVAPIWRDVERLEDWLGVGDPLWERATDPSTTH